MIEYKNIKRFDNLSFEDYMKLPGYSYSFLRSERNGIAPDIEVTNKMRLGSLVDGILTSPETVNMSDDLYSNAKTIASEIKLAFGSCLIFFKTQVSYTGEAQFKDYKIITKGRLDFLLEKHALIDLKITESKGIKALVDYMSYRNQIWHYCKLSNVKKAYLIIHSIPLKKSQIIEVSISDYNDFWASKILKFGTPI